MLTNADMESRSPMSVIILGQHWLRTILKTRLYHEALNQRITLRYSLEGLTEDETKRYVWKALQHPHSGFERARAREL